MKRDEFVRLLSREHPSFAFEVVRTLPGANCDFWTISGGIALDDYSALAKVFGLVESPSLPAWARMFGWSKLPRPLDALARGLDAAGIQSIPSDYMLEYKSEINGYEFKSNVHLYGAVRGTASLSIVMDPASWSGWRKLRNGGPPITGSPLYDVRFADEDVRKVVSNGLFKFNPLRGAYGSWSSGAVVVEANPDDEWRRIPEGK